MSQGDAFVKRQINSWTETTKGRTSRRWTFRFTLMVASGAARGCTSPSKAVEWGLLKYCRCERVSGM